MTLLIENKTWRPSLAVTSARHSLTAKHETRIQALGIPGLPVQPDFRGSKTNTGLDTIDRASFPALPLPAILIFNLLPSRAIEWEAITGEEFE